MLNKGKRYGEGYDIKVRKSEGGEVGVEVSDWSSDGREVTEDPESLVWVCLEEAKVQAVVEAIKWRRREREREEDREAFRRGLTKRPRNPRP